MKTKRIRWRLSQADIDRLSKTLKPIRSHREVAGLLGISIALVFQLESSGLSKVFRKLTEYENYEKKKQNKQNGESNHE